MPTTWIVKFALNTNDDACDPYMLLSSLYQRIFQIRIGIVETCCDQDDKHAGALAEQLRQAEAQFDAAVKSLAMRAEQLAPNN